MTQPGSIFHCTPPKPSDPARRHRDLQRQVQMNASAQTGQAMQIGAGGILVNGGGGITIEGTGSFNVGSGTLNAAGAITTQQGVTAGGAVESGNGAAEMDGVGNITGASVNVGGPVTAGGALSVGGTASISQGGSFTGANVIASGQVQSNGSPLKSLPSHNYQVSSSYVACWINGDGTLGTSQSSALVKTALVPMTATDAQALLNLTPYWGRYVWDDPTVPPRVFFLADDVKAAGFGPDVAPTVIGDPMTLTDPTGDPVLDPATGQPCVLQAGEAYTVNYSQMVVPLVAAWHAGAAQMQAMQTQVTLLQAQVKQLAAAAGVTLTETA